MSQTSIDARELRDALGAFVTGVTIITTRDAGGRPYGLTANSFSSVSLTPPLILWSQSLTAPSYPVFRDAERFAVSILAEGQTDLSAKFARSSATADKFTGVETIEGIGGIPLIAGAAAYLECRKVTSYPGGDHAVFLGEVERIERSVQRPLVFGGGKYLVAYPHDLGSFSIDLGMARATHLEAVRLGTAAAVQLAADLKTTISLAVWGTHGPTVVRWEESARPVNANLRTGVVLPILRSAAGQIFGAHLPRELTGELLAAELREWAPRPAKAAVKTPQRHPLAGGGLVEIDLERAAEGARRHLSITRPDAEALLADVRARGLARNIDIEPEIERDDKVIAIGAPVFDPEGIIVLSLTALSYAGDAGAQGIFASPVAAAVAAAARQTTERLRSRTGRSG